MCAGAHAFMIHRIFSTRRRLARDRLSRVGAGRPRPAVTASSTSGAVTRTIKAAKEVVIEIPAPKGMGYPALFT